MPRWFRVLGRGDYEVIERQVAEQGTDQTDMWVQTDTWVRYRCDSFTFLDQPGWETDQLPTLEGCTALGQPNSRPG